MQLISLDHAPSGHYENAGFHGCLSKDVAYRIRDTLPDARIVIFIRNQPDMLATTYMQYVRRGGTESVKRFLFPYRYHKRFKRKRFRKPMFLFDHFDYLNLIRHYQTVFGAASVHVFPYEAFSRNPREFMAGYARGFDLKLDLRRIDFRPTNRSYRRGTLRAARFLNHFAAGDAVYRSTWINLVPKRLRELSLEGWNRLPLQGQKPTAEQLLGSGIIRHIHSRFADSNRLLAAGLNLRLADYGYPMK